MKRCLQWMGLALLALGVGFLAVARQEDAAKAAPAERAAEVLGRQAEDFALRDFRGQEHRLSDWAEKKLVVVAFLGVECPLARAYATRLQELADQYAERGVSFVAIDSNQQDLPTEMEAMARSQGIRFPFLKDPGNLVADALGAIRTPEVFVLDGERRVRYWGRIDDQFIIGAQRKAPLRRDLAIALDELLASQPVSQPTVPALGCHIGRVSKVPPQGDVTWSSHVAAIIHRHCADCHRPGEIGPFPLLTYEDTAGWGAMIVEVTAERRMPPWSADPAHGKFKNDCSLSPEQLQTLRTWVDNGMPQGDPAAAPQPPEFVEGWRIGAPDQIFYIADQPFDVPATGEVKYQYFEIEPNFTEDRWIQAAEARPDNRGVVHHILMYIIPPGEKSREFRNRASAVGYAPGLPPLVLPEGVGLHVPRGSKIVFQMHYTPNGAPQADRSCVGVKYVPAASVKYAALGGMAANLSLEIPPGDPHHEVKSKYRFRKDMDLINITPHMHLRGKSFLIEAEYPDGRKEVLLNVPRYDFNWQLRYDFATPKRMPKGTWLRCTAHFDNSADNPANPDPTSKVLWGDQTWEEMMIGWFGAVPVEADGPGAQE